MEKKKGKNADFIRFSDSIEEKEFWVNQMTKALSFTRFDL